MVNINNCTVFVNSCDRYEEAWKPFFALFHEYWPDCPYEIVLATETKTCSEKGVRTINTGNGEWTTRVQTALRQVNTKYILFFLEDFFLLRPVKSDKLKEVFSYMEADDNIAVFYFNRIAGRGDKSEKYPGYYDMNKKVIVEYQLNCQVALWRKEVLEAATSYPCNPWEFEVKGYNHVNDFVKTKEYYCSIDTYNDAIRPDDIFSYFVTMQRGIGIARSHWLWNNKKLFREHNIDCKCETLKNMSLLEYIFTFWREEKWREFKRFAYPLYKILFKR